MMSDSDSGDEYEDDAGDDDEDEDEDEDEGEEEDYDVQLDNLGIAADDDDDDDEDETGSTRNLRSGTKQRSEEPTPERRYPTRHTPSSAGKRPRVDDNVFEGGSDSEDKEEEEMPKKKKKKTQTPEKHVEQTVPQSPPVSSPAVSYRTPVLSTAVPRSTVTKEEKEAFMVDVNSRKDEFTGKFSPPNHPTTHFLTSYPGCFSCGVVSYSCLPHHVPPLQGGYEEPKDLDLPPLLLFGVPREATPKWYSSSFLPLPFALGSSLPSANSSS